MILQNIHSYFPPEYAALEERGRPVVWLYLIIALFILMITLFMWRKFTQRKSKPALYLTIQFTLFSILVALLLAGFLDAYISGYKRQLYILSFAIGYPGLAISNIFLVLFAFSIFSTEEEQKYKYKYIVACLIAATLAALPYNYYGWDNQFIPGKLRFFRTMASAVLMISSLWIYIRIYKKAMKVARDAEERWAKMGLKFIAYGQVSFILFFVFVLLDTITYTISSEITGYTIFIYFAWISVIFGLMFLYIGFVMPQWFKKHYS